MPHIYLDHASATPTRSEAIFAMMTVLAAGGNPASGHFAGRRARQALEDAREEVAALLGAQPTEVIFTSGATEANNLALFGLAGDPPGRLLAGPLEHPCVLEPLRELVRRGFTLDWLPNAVADARLVTQQLVNHETGQIHAVPAGRTHTDAAQAVGKIPVHFADLGVTALAASGHKFGGPPGIGVLLLKRGVELRPLFFGGHQQQGRRPGTESAALAAGFAVALRLAIAELAAFAERARQLRARFLELLPGAVVTGDGVPHILNIAFPGRDAAELVLALDLAGVACSAGAACASGSLQVSPVLRAMGVPLEVARGALRFSFGRETTLAEIEAAAEQVQRVT